MSGSLFNRPFYLHFHTLLYFVCILKEQVYVKNGTQSTAPSLSYHLFYILVCVVVFLNLNLFSLCSGENTRNFPRLYHSSLHASHVYPLPHSYPLTTKQFMITHVRHTIHQSLMPESLVLFMVFCLFSVLTSFNIKLSDKSWPGESTNNRNNTLQRDT